jgi:hypothetical protein
MKPARQVDLNDLTEESISLFSIIHYRGWQAERGDLFSAAFGFSPGLLNQPFARCRSI